MLFSLRTFNFPVKSNFRYKYKQDVICRACGDPDSDESEIHLCESCDTFQNERDNKTLNFHDVFGPLDVQIMFIKKFKIISRKFKLLIEVENSTI